MKLLSKIAVSKCKTCPLATYHPLRPRNAQHECGAPGRPADPRIHEEDLEARPLWCPLDTRRVLIVVAGES